MRTIALTGAGPVDLSAQEQSKLSVESPKIGATLYKLCRFRTVLKTQLCCIYFESSPLTTIILSYDWSFELTKLDGDKFEGSSIFQIF